MEGQFKVGEILITQNMTPKYCGIEVVCFSGLAYRYWERECDGAYGEGMAYQVRWPDGFISTQLPSELRRRPPKQDHSAWAAKKVRDLLPTQPKEVA